MSGCTANLSSLPGLLILGGSTTLAGCRLTMGFTRVCRAVDSALPILLHAVTTQSIVYFDSKLTCKLYKRALTIYRCYILSIHASYDKQRKRSIFNAVNSNSSSSFYLSYSLCLFNFQYHYIQHRHK